MKKTLGIIGLLVFIWIVTALSSHSFLTEYNLENLARRSALFGIISIGAAFVIITSGIDLSIGSVVGLVGCLLPWLLVDQGCSVATALAIVLLISLAIGWGHGLLITQLRLQPFVVTLCGLLIYRGVIRGIVHKSVGFQGQFQSLRYLSQGTIPLPGTEFDLPVPCVILVVLATAAAVFLNLTVYGRYLLALGRNEEAARFSGISTNRMIVLAYVLCALISGFGGVLFVLDTGSAQPVDYGNSYELYAIAAAVLGGCSLRGGEGSILGVVIGAAVMQSLRNAITLIDWLRTDIEFAVIGAVILGGVITDELVKRYAAHRQAVKARQVCPPDVP